MISIEDNTPKHPGGDQCVDVRDIDAMLKEIMSELERTGMDHVTAINLLNPIIGKYLSRIRHGYKH